MIIEHVRRGLEHDVTVEPATPEVVLEAVDSVLVGELPFLTQEHPLAVPVGSCWPLWHDGTAWRVGVPGWGDRHAERVVEWPVADVLDARQRYKLIATEDTEGTVLRAVPE